MYRQDEVKVSVIVPVYNVQDYLGKCLDSLLMQTFKPFEILCIEDGSTDGSLEILRRYEQKDSRVRMIRHEKNKGLSAARNTGLEAAKGKYVIFVDSDDLLHKDAISLLYEDAEQLAVDVVYFDLKKIYGDEDIEKASRGYKPVYQGKRDVLSGRHFFSESVARDRVIVSACGQFINKDFLSEHGIKFLEGILHEDNLFTFYVMMEAARVCYMDSHLYYYRQHKGSIMTLRDEKRAQSMFVVIANIFVYIKTHEFTEEEGDSIRYYLEQLYHAYLFYESYGEDVKSLSVGDVADRMLYGVLRKEEKAYLQTDKIPMDEVRSHRCVIVYGAGRAARQVILYLRQYGVMVDAVMVSDKERNADLFCGIQVCGISEYDRFGTDVVIVVGTMERHSGEIAKALEERGIENIITIPDVI